MRRNSFLTVFVLIVILNGFFSKLFASGGDSVIVLSSFNEKQNDDIISFIHGEKVLEVSRFTIDTSFFYKYTILRYKMQRTIQRDENCLFVFSGLRDGKKILIPDLNQDGDFTNDPFFEYPIRKNQRKIANDSVKEIQFSYSYILDQNSIINRIVSIELIPFEPYIQSAINDEELMQVYIKSAYKKSAIALIGDRSYRFSFGSPADFEAQYDDSYIRIEEAIIGSDVLFEPELFVGESFELDGQFLQIDSVSLFADSIYLRILSKDKIYGVRTGNFLSSEVLNKVSPENWYPVSFANPDAFLLVDFWGSWCQPCIESIPYLSDIYEKYGSLKDFDMLSIAWENGVSGIKDHSKIVSDFKMNWRHIVEMRDKTKNLESLTKLLRVFYFPTILLIDGTGRIVYRGVGVKDVIVVSGIIEKSMLDRKEKNGDSN